MEKKSPDAKGAIKSLEAHILSSITLTALDGANTGEHKSAYYSLVCALILHQAGASLWTWGTLAQSYATVLNTEALKQTPIWIIINIEVAY